MTFKERYKKQREDFAEFMKWYPFTLEDLDGEQWADIEGYEGRYQISTFGRVKSLPWKQRPTPRILCPKLSTGNYLDIVLWKNDKPKPILIHRLVAQAFIPNPDNKPQINHIDGCKINAYVGNLEWVTRSENIRHAYNIGLIVLPKGEENHNSKLTNEQARQIRDYRGVLSDTELGRKFGVSKHVVCGIKLGKIYKIAGGTIRAKIEQPVNKIANELREKIRQEYVKGSSQFGCRGLAKKYGVGRQTISNIINEK